VVGLGTSRASHLKKFCAIYPTCFSFGNKWESYLTHFTWIWPRSVSVFMVQKALVEQMKSKAKEGTLKTVNGSVASGPPAKRRRWDVSSVGPADETPHKQAKSSWDAVEANTPSQSRWDDTPGRAKGGETPGATPGASTRQWDQTPGHASSGAATPGRETPGQQVTPSARRNRWDETPKTDRGLGFFSLTNSSIAQCFMTRG